MGCHFLLQGIFPTQGSNLGLQHCRKMLYCLSHQGIPGSESHSVVSNSLQPHGLYSPWTFPGQNTGVGSLFLLQGIFPTQGLNPGLPHCKLILYQLSHKDKAVAKTLECLPTTAGPAACGGNFDAKPTRPQHQRAFPPPDETFLEPKIEPQGPSWTHQVSLNKAHAPVLGNAL